MSLRVTEPATPRGQETRAHILETALALFRECGYENTTMRAIAERAGVSLGNAYYYFTSKEHLIQSYYRRSHEEHLERCIPALESARGMKARLKVVLHTKIDASEPYHRFAGQLFKVAADPQSPLNPFHEQSLPLRRDATELLASAIEGEKPRVPDDLAESLPNLLWLHEMGIILYWIHDTSLDSEKTRKLIDRSVDVIVRLIQLSRLPFMKPVRRAALRLLDELGPTEPRGG